MLQRSLRPWNLNHPSLAFGSQPNGKSRPVQHHFGVFAARRDIRSANAGIPTACPTPDRRSMINDAHASRNTHDAAEIQRETDISLLATVTRSILPLDVEGSSCTTLIRCGIIQGGSVFASASEIETSSRSEFVVTIA